MRSYGLLRGRVIRSNHQAYCYLLPNSTGEAAVKRLKALKEAKNGFELSELDLALRGAGELGGTKQWGITDLGMLYAVGIRPATTVWAPGTAPLPPKPWVGRGIRPTRLRREPGHEPVAVKALAMALPPGAYGSVTWREGTNSNLTSRFAALRVRPAHRDYLGTEMRPQEWLLIEWPAGEVEPTKYFLSTAPADATTEQLVFVTKMRWRIERDYQELKQEFGLSHYEGRGWQGFHHHATLCIAAYGYLVAQRLKHGGSKKNFARPEALALPNDYVPRGRRTSAAPCA